MRLHKCLFACLLTWIFLCFSQPQRAMSGPRAISDTRQRAAQLQKDGNFQESLQLFRKLTIIPENSNRVNEDLANAVHCLQRLGRIPEFDELVENTVAAHSENWRLLSAAARQYLSIQHQGHMIAGEFERGPHRGGRDSVHAIERDRLRALQLMVQALPLVADDDNKSDVAGFHWNLAHCLLFGQSYQNAWRLQLLTDLNDLPDYQKGYHHSYGSPAPVDAAGNPIFHYSVAQWSDAQTDGERWRWALDQVAENASAQRSQVLQYRANFYQQQFGVQTMQNWSGIFARHDQPVDEDSSGTYALHKLGEHETIARLATGIERFELPDEFNHIKIHQQILAGLDPGSHQSLRTLAEIFENRRQFSEAARYWKELTTHTSKSIRKQAQQRRSQIVGNWGRFEGTMAQPAGQAASIEFLFRNATRVHLTAHQIDIESLLQDVKKYIRSKPKRLDHRKINISDIGYRIVQENEQKYIGDKVADWERPLEPRPNHVDRRITIHTPLQKAGAYLLRAKLKDGNVSNIIIWVSDTAIAKKQLSGKALYFVADAVDGRPIANANIEFFGFRQEHPGGKRYRITTSNFAERTDRNGQLIPDPRDLQEDMQWVAMARTDDGRLAYLGFDNIWRGQYYDAEYNATKVFVITDRPVYRPDQTVQFKLWVRHAMYDMEDTSEFARQSFHVILRDPHGVEILKEQFTADEYGGIGGEYQLPTDAALGRYSISLTHPNQNHGLQGGGNFRVEEYKKPEFEVTVVAPEEPLMLGETVTAQIKADYYFGSPVTKAHVKFKVTRSSYSETWYPIMPWDWCFGPGYWWFSYDYPWYPGWDRWVGCMRPTPWWWHRPTPPPEIVMEREVEIGPSGTVDVVIDTAFAQSAHPDQDHRYTITAEVVDESRRTIVGTGQVLVARQPFRVFTWVNRGYYRVGDTMTANFLAQSLDRKPVAGRGELTLLKISYDDQREPIETSVQTWQLDTGQDGNARQQLVASRPGQYRLSYRLTDSAGHTVEGGYMFTVSGERFDGRGFRFNHLELIPDQREYAPGETVRLQINTDRADSTVLLFVRPSNGIYLPPKLLRLNGKSTVEDIVVVKRDMPNFFVEAVTVSDGKVHSETKEIVVPPEKRVVNVDVLPSAETFQPGEQATIRLRLTDMFGEPVVGSTVVSVYDKSVEYISGGSNVNDIREFFWKWRRRHQATTSTNLQRYFHNRPRPNEPTLQPIGVFGADVADEMVANADLRVRGAFHLGRRPSNRRFSKSALSLDAAAAPASAEFRFGQAEADVQPESADSSSDVDGALVQPTVRSNFADTALWLGMLETDNQGLAELSLQMPENLTTWKVGVWSMSHGTKVGTGSVEIITRKNLIVRLQAPRFFVEKDEVVLSANVHNYLEHDKLVSVTLDLPGEELEPLDNITQQVTISAGSERRVDWRVLVVREGLAVVRMSARTDKESDAVEMKFPSYVHGMLKTESWAGTVQPDQENSRLTIHVPSERRIDDSLLEIRFSPTLAGAMVDALPYLADYPYGCTEQTLNRFLPSVITQKVLLDMNLDLGAIRDKRTNLNAQEIGDDVVRNAGWKRFKVNPVFDELEVARMVKEGIKRLTEMQNSDGGWGWFSGSRESSWPHTTAIVVHGLQLAEQNGVTLVPNVLDHGIAWLRRYQQNQISRIKNWGQDNKRPRKQHADNLDAMICMVLVDADVNDVQMQNFLYRDRNELAVYSKAMLGLALHVQNEFKKRDMLIRNIEQFLVQDEENETAYLRLPGNAYWWYWYGNETEANAYYLKLLTIVQPHGSTAPRLVKYLLNNRKHATYWASTRDTALCVEAFADYLRATDELSPEMVVHLSIDGELQRSVEITRENLFTFDNRLVLAGNAVQEGSHEIELRREGRGPIYFNAYLTNFTLEDYITRAGLEVKVNRKYYQLIPVVKTTQVAGGRGQVVQQRVEKYERQLLDDWSALRSGDLVEVELEMESKNDYEYLIFEDMKPAGFEPVDLRSGYTDNGMNAYMELRDNRVAFFVRSLARGRHSVTYRLRAEIPGRFSALPARAYAMYAPELRGNSDEIKLRIED